MKKKAIKTAIKFCAFVIIANLPFLTMTQLIGVDTFLDSFHNQDSYQCIKNENAKISNIKAGYIILEKPTHKDYTIQKGDTILYRITADTLQTKVVYQTATQRGVTTYYTTTDNEYDLDGPIYDYQILGKITGVIDDNIWNALSLQIWELSRDNLNAVALFTND